MTSVLPTSKRWVISPRIPASINSALNEFSPLLRQLLYNRGISDSKTAWAYVRGEASRSTDPFLMTGMNEAVETLHNAITGSHKIAIYGDYDVDGVTSSALLFEFFREIGVEARVYIPNRFDEGYGLNMEAIETLAGEGVQLMITVDCGIRSVKEVDRAKALGLHVILSDHHTPGENLPQADAVLNPKQPGDFYPYKDLAGVGLAYKFVQAYLERHPCEGLKAEHWLDLVAIGTVADIAPLTDENRALVKAGLVNMRQVNRQGLFSLCQVAGIRLENINAGNIGFGIGPRLNAAGRMDTAMDAFHLLTATDIYTAGMFAQKLETQNRQRKEITEDIQTRALEMALAAEKDAPFIFAAAPDFSEGVVGLAASRVVETVYRPAIIGHQSEDCVVASCRSIPEFNIVAALDQCRDLLVRHGGHAMAAGLTVTNQNLPAFLERFNQLAHKALDGMELNPMLAIDREIALERVRPEDIPGILEDVATLEPTGSQNPEVLFCSHRCQVRNARTMSDGQHLKFFLHTGDRDWEAIAFRQGHWINTLPAEMDIVYYFDVNVWNGHQTLQLNIRDIKPSDPQN
ncbi:MAG: single-stranded-DNA-specific exonuclease RecJ [Anaerolineaceae bacterium]